VAYSRVTPLLESPDLLAANSVSSIGRFAERITLQRPASGSLCLDARFRAKSTFH